MASPSTQHPQVNLWIEHRRVAGWVLVFGPGLIGLVGLALGLTLDGLPLLQLAAAPCLLTAILLLVVRRRLGQRVRAAGSGAAAPRTRRRLAFFLGLGGIVTVGLVWMFGHRIPALLTLAEAPVAWLTATVLGVLVLVAGLVLSLFARFYATTDAKVLPEAHGLAIWLRCAAWITLLAGLFLVTPALHDPATGLVHLLAHRAGEGFLVVGLGELALRGVLRKPARRDPAFHPFLLSLVASRWNPVSSLFGTLTDAFGIDLRGTWALRFIQRSLLPLAAGLATLAWLGTSFSMVDTTEVGVLETFGSPSDAEPLGPGLAVHLPWPFQAVRRVDTERVYQVPIGFVGDTRGASLLWTRRHAEEEYALLLGDGEDLITVNAILHFRISDPLAYLYRVRDAEEALAALADRALMHETVGHTLESVLSENVATLTGRIQSLIMDEADRLGLGLEVLDFNLIGLHPPLAVAREYQAVVGAQIEIDTLVYEAEADRARAIPAAKAQAHRAKADANAGSEARLAAARGEAQAFTAQVEAHAASPDLFRFRRWIETRETVLRRLSFVVIDERFFQQGAEIHTQVLPPQEDNDR